MLRQRHTTPMSCSVWQPSRLRKQKQSNTRHKKDSISSVSMGEQVLTSTPTNGPMLGRSNLDCFLDHITPSVQCHYPPKISIGDAVSERWKFHSESMPFFNLGDLWRAFDEWSAYGAGVPLRLPCGETIVQYYVPYLSALQIYLHPGCSLFSNKRRLGDESDWSDASDLRDASSDFGSDNENEKMLVRLQMKADQWDSSSCVSSERLSSASSEQGDRQGDLVFEYFERCSPYGRAPLAGKISELATRFPHLHSLRSNELSPASWVSVAWYPIYRIPTGPTMRDLSTCFLTFHSLWIPPLFQDAAMDMNHQIVKELFDHNTDVCSLDSDHSSKQEQEQWLQDHSAWRIKSGMTLELPAFGLASYKLRGPFWASAGAADKERVSSLASSADSWLRQLRVQHPDFDFFASREGTGSY